MRHRIDGNRIGRNSGLRKATIRDIAKAALVHQRICTTKAKAKQARRLVERLITLGKKGTLAAKRRAFSVLCDHQIVSDLFSKVAQRFKTRIGGYTRIIPLPYYRRGDNGYLVYLELTEKEVVPADKPVSKTKLAAAPLSKKEKEKAEKVTTPEAVLEQSKLEVPAAQPKKDLPKAMPKDMARDIRRDMRKSPKPFFGGIKKIFTKKPSAE